MDDIRVTPHNHIVFTEFDDGEGVLVDLNTKRYYQLNETAALVWRALEQGKSTREVVEELTAVYDVTREHATESVEKLLRSFQSNKLVVQS
ncbi:MAG TPA: PqqD family protein [Pyrinomonadaceae bacterium]|nr:PqqD family protein [Pyrinomonadaceae bacterium]